MVSKTQNNIGFLFAGFIIGFVSGYHYTYRRKTVKILPPNIDRHFESELESELDPERSDPELDPVVDFTPVNYVTTYRATYATLDELIKTTLETNREEKNEELSLRQKYSLMEDYSYIISLSYSQACRLVETKGYTLQVSSVQGSSQNLPTDNYSSTTFGVEIRDPQYNFKMNTPSKKAVIVSINNVGPPGTSRVT